MEAFILVLFLACGGWLAWFVITHGFTAWAAGAAVFGVLGVLVWLDYDTPDARAYRKLVRENRRIGKARRRAQKELDR